MESLKVGKLIPFRRSFVESPLSKRTYAPRILAIWIHFAIPPRVCWSPLLLPHLDSHRVRWSPSTHLKVGKLFPTRRPFVESPPILRTLRHVFLGFDLHSCYPTSTIVEFVEILQLMPLIDLCQFDQKVAKKISKLRVLLMIINSKWATCYIEPKIW